MPETLRTANEGLRSRPRRGCFPVAFVLMTHSMLPGTPAHAGAIENLYGALSAVNGQWAATLTLLLSLISFLVLAVIVLMRTRKGAVAAKVLAHEESAALHVEIDRLK